MNTLITFAVAFWRMTAPPPVQASRRGPISRNRWGHPGKDPAALKAKAMVADGISRGTRRVKITH